MSSHDWFDGAIDLTSQPLVTPPTNGHSFPGEPAAPAPVPADDLDSVPWFQAYDRASVEAYLAALDDEKARLEADIADAERRTAVAQQALAARIAELEAGLGTVVLAAREELARIEREQEEAVAAIRAEAEAEAGRIRAAARLEAGTVREASASLAELAARRPDLRLPPTVTGLVPPIDGGSDAG